MAKQAQAFDDGDMIYRRGDAAGSAYRLVTGNVELEPGRDGAETTLLGPGDVFGEPGDDRDDEDRYQSSARAIGPIAVEPLDGRALGRAVRKVAQAMAGTDRDPSRTSKKASPAGHALISATTTAIAPATAANGPPKKSRPLISGFFEKLIGRDEADGHDRLDILVGGIFGDENGGIAKVLATELDRRRGLKVHVDSRKAAPLQDEDAVARISAENQRHRRRLARTGADAMITGEVVAPIGALNLRIIPARAIDPDLIGAGGDYVVLALPPEADDATMDFLHAVLLAQILPRAEGKALTRRRDLPLAVEAAAATFADSNNLTLRQQASLLAATGRLHGALAGLKPKAEHFQAALDHFDAALSHIDALDPVLDVERALLEKDRALALQNLAERTNNTELLQQSVGVIQTALDILDRRHFPWHWGALQHRLGLAVFRLDFDSGDAETMKQALAAYQAALTIYSRRKTPRKWADIMGHFAQAAQVLGEQVRSPETLAKAAAACQSVLEVRRKSDGPLLWAATQNNLGAALFLLGKLTRRIAHLEGAEQAFELALSVYTTRGTERMAYVTEKNLDHVRRLLERILPKDPLARVDSFEIGADLNKPDYDKEREAWV